MTFYRAGLNLNAEGSAAGVVFDLLGCTAVGEDEAQVRELPQAWLRLLRPFPVTPGKGERLTCREQAPSV